MAKGYQANQERLQALQLLGRDLARRAKSKCEVCLAAGVPLATYEVPPAPKEPDLDHCIFVCPTCADALNQPDRKLDGKGWRALAHNLWTEVPAAQVCVVRLLRRLAPSTDWARETLEEAYLDEATEAWVDQG